MRIIGITVAFLAVMVGIIVMGQAQSVVRVGVFATGGPMTLFDEGSGHASGATVEILQAIAKDMGLKLQYVTITGAGSKPFVAALASDTIDVIAYCFQMTADRKAQFDFSEPVLSYGEAIIVHKDDPKDYRSASDLKGLSLGVVAGSNYIEIAARVGANPKIGNSLSALMMEVNTGKLVAAMGSAPTLLYAVQQGTYPHVRVPSHYVSDEAMPAGFGVRKGNVGLLKTINAGLAKLQADGTVKKILEQYGL